MITTAAGTLDLQLGSNLYGELMSSLSISEAADSTGFSPSALRFYERNGLVQPERSAAGYRLYDEQQMAALRFIRRAKRFGLTLDEITDVMALLDQERCEPVQRRLTELVDAKIRQARDQMTELASFTAELQRVAANLGAHTPEGPCDASCRCTSDPEGELDGSNGPSIACTLPPGEMPERLSKWRAVLDQSTGHEQIDGGVRLRFDPALDVPAVTQLLADELACCRWFEFTLVDERVGHDPRRCRSRDGTARDRRTVRPFASQFVNGWTEPGSAAAGSGAGATDGCVERNGEEMPRLLVRANPSDARCRCRDEYVA